jgi:hypothetical protein
MLVSNDRFYACNNGAGTVQCCIDATHLETNLGENMNIAIFEPNGSTSPINCEFCHMPIDGTGPAESLIPESAKGKYGKLVIAHTRCAAKVKKKMHHVGAFVVIKASDSSRPQHNNQP